MTRAASCSRTERIALTVPTRRPIATRHAVGEGVLRLERRRRDRDARVRLDLERRFRLGSVDVELGACTSPAARRAPVSDAYSALVPLTRAGRSAVKSHAARSIPASAVNSAFGSSSGASGSSSAKSGSRFLLDSVRTFAPSRL